MRRFVVEADSLRRRVVAASRGRGIRLRSTAAAVVVVLVALAAGGAALVLLLHASLESTARLAAQTRATEVASIVQGQGVRAAAATIQAESRSGQLVQILSSDGQVIAASSGLVAATPMSPQRPPPGVTRSTEADIDQVRFTGDWRVVSTGIIAHGRAYIVQVGVPIDVQQETVRIVAVFLLFASPLLLAAVAVGVWTLVGRALAAVERIRAEVAMIDEQRIAQRVEVPQTDDEVAALATTMNTMLDRLEASQQAQRAFVSDASHELRSPLATMSAATELAMGADEATRTRLLGTISDELARVATLVDNLMILARADAYARGSVHQEVDLDDLVDAEVHRLAATSRRAVIVEVEPIRLVDADPQRLGQALRNLVDNAERHATGTIRLSLHRSEDAAVLCVDNDGPIVPPQDRQRIFERFVRLDESRSRDAGGSGLGLAIARAAAESHGGTVEARTSEDGWCRFELRLPAPPMDLPLD